MPSIAAKLTTLLGDDLVTPQADIPPHYRTDWSEIPGQQPAALVRPRSTADVQKTLQYCHQQRITVVPQGGRTGLAGSATVIRPDCIVLSMERMHHIEALDTQADTMLVQAGTTLEAVQQAAAAHGLLFSVDLGARGSCQIGGAVATNAGGNGVLQHGMMRDQVLGLEVVLADGTVLPMLRPMIKNNTGYDLKHFFIGSEGTLGVITRVLLRLFPAPQARLTALIALPDYAAALALLSQLKQHFPAEVAAFELMWQDFWHWSLTHQHLKSPFEKDHPFYALIDLSGNNTQSLQSGLEQLLASAFENGLIQDATIAQSQTQAQALWKIREATAEFFAGMHPPINFDVSVPITQIGAFADACASALAARWPGHVTVRFGHVGDSNLHLSTDGAHIDGSDKEVEQLIYQTVADFGGSVSAEHGIGLHKKAYLGASRTEQELATMKLIKQALDPLHILNPGKIF